MLITVIWRTNTCTIQNIAVKYIGVGYLCWMIDPSKILLVNFSFGIHEKNSRLVCLMLSKCYVLLVSSTKSTQSSTLTPILRRSFDDNILRDAGTTIV